MITLPAAVLLPPMPASHQRSSRAGTVRVPTLPPSARICSSIRASYRSTHWIMSSLSRHLNKCLQPQAGSSNNYSDGQSLDPYYIEETEKQKHYTATVRVPHDKYDSFLNGANQLGDIRSKSSNVENLGQEYTDLNTTLQIYEAKEKRYLKMLSTITDDEQAIRVEKELTELQVKIAGIKTRMTEIQTDVDYSTIELNLREVTKYNEAPEQTDTFFQRLGNTVSDTWKNFGIFLEAMLFFFIRILPYAVIIGLIVLVVLWITKKRKWKRDSDKKEPDKFPK